MYSKNGTRQKFIFVSLLFSDEILFVSHVLWLSNAREANQIIFVKGNIRKCMYSTKSKVRNGWLIDRPEEVFRDFQTSPHMLAFLPSFLRLLHCAGGWKCHANNCILRMSH